MQTITVIQTVEWINSLFSTKAKERLFAPGFGRTESDKISYTLEVSHELARISSIIAENKAAAEVLNAFELGQLADLSFGANYAQATLMQKSGEPRDPSFLLSTKWRIMLTAAKAWKQLTIPLELTKKDDSSIISIELQFEGVMPPASVLAKAINALEELYEAISNAYQIDRGDTLKVVKTDSGSNIRIDCKGVADIVKHLKDFFLEAWHKIRHKRAEEITENNKALMSSLAVVQQIDSLVSSGSITNEEAERIKYRIINSTFTLLDNRALPGNIPNNENVNNIKMLDSFSPKLLNQHNNYVEPAEIVEDVVTKPKNSPPKRSASSPAKQKKNRTSTKTQKTTPSRNHPQANKEADEDE